MARYIARRLGRGLVTLWGASLIVFLIAYVVPGDVADVLLGEYGTPQDLDALRTRLGLNEPIHKQYWLFLKRIVTGDLGTSVFFERPAFDMLLEASRVTLLLAGGSLLIGVAVSMSAGILAAVRRNTWVDFILITIAMLGLSTPGFVSGLIFILVFGVYLGWLPISGLAPPSSGVIEYVRHLVLPWLSLGFALTGVLTRFTRSGMLEVLGKDYVRVARAKGLPESAVLSKHAFRNALLPIITVVGLQFGVLMGGAIFIEVLFGLPGLGRLIVRAIGHRDFAIVHGAVLLVALVFITINTIVDLLYGILDPRIRYE